MLIATTALKFLFGQGHPMPTIGQTGQGVGGGQAAQFGVGALQLGVGSLQGIQGLTKAIACLLEFQMHPHPGQEFRRSKGLGDVVHSAKLKGFEHVGFFVAGRDKQHGNIPQDWIFFQAIAQLQTAHSRHHQIQQNQIRLGRSHPHQRFGSRHGKCGFIARLI